MFDKLYPFPENLELQVQILSRCTYCYRTVRWVDNKKYIGTCKEDRIYNSSINIYLLFNCRMEFQMLSKKAFNFGFQFYQSFIYKAVLFSKNFKPQGNFWRKKNFKRVVMSSPPPNKIKLVILFQDQEEFGILPFQKIVQSKALTHPTRQVRSDINCSNQEPNQNTYDLLTVMHTEVMIK